MFYVVFVGVLMGLANLIPGVSGGTIALLAGVYSRFIAAVASLSRLKFDRSQFLFLLQLGTGILVGILAFSNLLELALARTPSLMYGAFSGLVLGGIPVVFKKIERIDFSRIGAFVAGLFLVLFMTFSGSGTVGPVPWEHDFLALAYDVAAGFVGAAAMVLPGLSGAFVLLIMGEYSRAISAINRFDILIVASLGLGVILGIIFISRLLKFLLKKYHDQTFAFLLGLMAGSLPDLLTRTGSKTRVFTLIVGVFFGVLFSYLLTKLERKSEPLA